MVRVKGIFYLGWILTDAFRLLPPVKLYYFPIFKIRCKTQEKFDYVTQHRIISTFINILIFYFSVEEDKIL